MNPNVVKPIVALLVAALTLAGTLGLPIPVDVGLVGQKIELVLAALLGGGLFVRQHWFFGDKASTQPAVKTSPDFWADKTP